MVATPRQICMTTPGLGRLIGRRVVRRLWTRTRFAHTMAHTPLSSLVLHLSFSSHHIALDGKYSGASKGPVGPACGRRGWQTRSTWRSVPGRRPMSGPPTEPSRARTHAPGPGMGACQLRGTDSDELPGRQSISCCSYRKRTVGKGLEWTETANVTFFCCCRGTAAHSLLAVACMPSLD